MGKADGLTSTQRFALDSLRYNGGKGWVSNGTAVVFESVFVSKIVAKALEAKGLIRVESREPNDRIYLVSSAGGGK